MTRPLVVLVILLAAAAPNAAGQGRSVRGMVTDQDGEPLRGAVVKIKNTSTLQVRSYVTQPDGEYRFHGLHRDTDYEVKARYRGEASKTKRLNWYDARTEARINFKLRLRGEAHRAPVAVLNLTTADHCGEIPLPERGNPNDF